MVAPEIVAGVVERGPGDVFALSSRHTGLLGQAQHALKRVIDIVLAAIGILVLSPVLAGIALAVLFTSGTPVLYPWLVVGRRGRPFVGYKFRTMVRDADKQLALLAAQNEMKGPAFKMKQDPRVTPVGRFLRRLSLDELPQLWSVLKGDMSLVGPRPPLRTEYARFEPWQRRKLAVTPGITCLWQISGRADINDFDSWVKLDIEYIERWSLWLDLKILVGTLGAVVRGKGAY
jgi:lipopolysaccharide/colanic/teichoic acid biosynthesis glycosyltransferase